MRLDVFLTEKDYFSSREKARRNIEAGMVFVNGIKITKPSFKINEKEDHITIEGILDRYVGRGGQKLEKAIDTFGISLENKYAIDVGASTGGFTDCMLKRGVRKVIAIDVGHGQLAEALRMNEKVINMEGVNVRYCAPGDLEFLADFLCIDVSFISLTLLFGVLSSFLKPDGEMVCLIKPQFEAGKEKVGKNGIVRDEKVHEEVLEKVKKACETNGFEVKGMIQSPIKGAEGNVEYLMYAKRLKNKGVSGDHDEIRTFY